MQFLNLGLPCVQLALKCLGAHTARRLPLGKRVFLRLGSGKRLFRRRHLRLHLGKGALHGIRGRCGGLYRFVCLLCKLGLMCNLVFGNLIGAVRLVNLFLQRAHLGEQLFGCHLRALALLKQLVALRFECAQAVFGNLQLVCGEADRFLRLGDFALQNAAVMNPQADIRALFALVNFEVLLRLLRFLFQRADPTAELARNIGEAHQVFIRGGEFFLRLVLLVAILGDARRLFKDIAPVLALARKDLGNLALSDDRIALAPDAGVHEQLMNILQPHRAAIDEILALARAEIAARDRDLVIGDIHAVLARAVVKGDRHLGKTHRLARVRTPENDILHLGAADILAGNLTKHPAHRVRNIGFAAAVRPDDHGGARLKIQHRLIRKRLETVQFKRFQVHAQPSVSVKFAMSQDIMITKYILYNNRALFSTFFPNNLKIKNGTFRRERRSFCPLSKRKIPLCSFFAKQLERLLRRHLLGGALALALAAADDIAVEPCLNREALVVVGPALVYDEVFEDLAARLLHDLLQDGLEVLRRAADLQLGKFLHQKRLQKRCHAILIPAAVEEHRGQQRLKRVGKQRRAFAPAAKLLAVPEAQKFTESDFLCQYAKRLFTDDFGAHPRELPLGAVRKSGKQIFACHQREH